MASKAAYKRLSKEYLGMQRNPTPYITAKPLESNILEWHYVLRGPPETPYEGGEYHGRLRFPADYPYKPPAIQMITPSGRFQTNTNICMSMSNFHPNTWNPAWSVSTILNGMLSFMVEEEVTTGSIRTSEADRRALARKSHMFNMANKLFVRPATGASPSKKQPVSDGTEDRSCSNDLGHKTAASAPAMEETPVAPAVAVANNQRSWLAVPTLSSKWVILIVVLAYVFASKVVTRLLTAA
ncbi:UBC-like protein [Linderina pennispora]|uniref:Ubiquitin-conjugating enzyme E2 6 n=1 Tax=Linderina pennispora TaxID=61395 RepID=A0A1Y1W1P7_9FUNG|nr:UBC-like protein [Linderina pennispora]ORX67428.1 UBC-like protein [Linderina pennispora]